VAALRHRARMLQVTAQGFRDMIVAGRADINKPIHVKWMFELWMARAEGEVRWCEQIADEIEAGVSYMPANVAPDTDDGWQAYRDRVAESEE
jgi:hypothetical protein